MKKSNRILRKSCASSETVLINITDTFRIIHVEGNPGFLDADIRWMIAGQRADTKYSAAKITFFQEESRL